MTARSDNQRTGTSCAWARQTASLARTVLLLALVAVAGPGASANPPATAPASATTHPEALPTTLYTNRLPDGRQVVVRRREIPYEPEKDDFVKALPPGAKAIPPDHLYRVDFLLQEAPPANASPQQPAEKILLTREIADYGYGDGGVRILLGTVQGDTLVLVTAESANVWALAYRVADGQPLVARWEEPWPGRVTKFSSIDPVESASFADTWGQDTFRLHLRTASGKDQAFRLTNTDKGYQWTKESTKPVWTPMLSGSQDFSIWKDTKQGSWAQFSTTSTLNGKTDKGGEILTLVKVARNELTLARKVTRTDDSGKAVTRSDEFTLSPMSRAGITVPPKFEGTEDTEGDEDLQVDGQTLKCHWRKLKVSRDGGYYIYTIWTSPIVPGLIVKQASQTNITKPGGAKEESSTERLLTKWGTEPTK